GAKERALLAVLAVHANRVLSEDFLVEALWGDDPPRTAARTLQGYVSRVRKALADASDVRSVSIESHQPGWSLRLDADALDLTCVDAIVERGRLAAAASDPVGAALAFADALRLWRGRPLEEFVDQPWAMGEAARLEEVRLVIIEDRVDAELA